LARQKRGKGPLLKKKRVSERKRIVPNAELRSYVANFSRRNLNPWGGGQMKKKIVQQSDLWKKGNQWVKNRNVLKKKGDNKDDISVVERSQSQQSGDATQNLGVGKRKTEDELGIDYI